MKRKQLSLLVLAAFLVPMGARANDIEPGKENYPAAYRTNTITIDGNMSDWDTTQFWKDTQFYIPKGSGSQMPPTGTLVTFEQCDACGLGGSWTGPNDASSAFSIAWDLDYLYVGLVVVDDYHVLTDIPNSPWNGDCLQLAFTDADRTAIKNLYNVGLTGTNEHLGSFEVDTAGGEIPSGNVNEQSSGSGLSSPRIPLFAPTLTITSNVAIVRDSTISQTYYELRFPAASLGYDTFTNGMKLGVGLCVNDGDQDSPGQSGWSGWGAHAIVFGKTASEAGLVTLQAGPLEVTRELPANLAMNAPLDTSIEADVTENGLMYKNNSAILKLNGQTVAATVRRNGSIVTVTYQPPTKLQRGRTYHAQLEYQDTDGKSYSKSWTFTAIFLVPGSLFIEAEDFNFGAGLYITDQPIGMTGAYPGGAYQDQSALKGTDYNDDGANIKYRESSVQVSVDVGRPDTLNRGTFDVATNWVVVANTNGDWYNYTRDFPTPAKTYNVYARLASGGGAINASLDLVTSIPDQPDQTLTNLGTFTASATGSFDVYGFVPLRDADGNVLIVKLPGEQSPTTLRFTVLPGDLNFDYLAFIPVSQVTPKLNADGSVTITWTNGGTLESADNLAGPYTSTGNSTGTATVTKANLGSHKFYRISE